MNNLSYHNYRSVTPEETYKKILPFLKDMGITRVANITGLDEIGIPVYIAIRPNSRSLSLSQGKGISPLNAKISAIMETIEAYHAEYIENEVFEASINEMLQAGRPVCDYNNISAYKDQNLDKRLKIKWVMGKDLISGKEVYVPFEAVHVDMRVSEVIKNPYFIRSSNGLASGNNLQEAVNHAACEIMERDSYACWSLRSSEYRQATKVKIESVDCQICKDLIKRFQKAGVYLGIWDITSDSGLPSFLVRVISKDKPPLCLIPPASGFACHPDKNLSLMRALTEAAQSRLTFIAGARDDIRLSHYRTFSSPLEYDRWYQSVYEQQEYKNFKDIPHNAPQDTRGVWEAILRSLDGIGIKEAICVDLTKESFGINVVKVVIPGLEGCESYRTMKMGNRGQAIVHAEGANGDKQYA